MDIWSFENEASENEVIARKKEHSERRKMAWLLGAKVAQVVVEMVEKVVVEIGCLVEKEEEEEGGVVVVVLE